MTNNVEKFLLTSYVKYCKIQKNTGGDYIAKKNKTIQEWLEIKNIFNEGIIELENNKFIKILKITPINYNLKSDLEKSSILNSYKIFLKTCNFDIQILIQSNKEDLSHHISKIKNNLKNEKNENLKIISENYIEYIINLNKIKKSSSKDFYIIISNEKIKNNENINSDEIIKNDLKEKYFKIKECLSRCGNSVIEINEREKIEEIFFSFLNTRNYFNNIFNYNK